MAGLVRRIWQHFSSSNRLLESPDEARPTEGVSRKRMRSPHQAQQHATTPRRVEGPLVTPSAIQSHPAAGRTVERQAPAAQQQRRRQPFSSLEERRLDHYNDGGVSPHPMSPLASQTGHFPSAGPRGRWGSLSPSPGRRDNTLAGMRVQQQQQSLANPWNKPMHRTAPDPARPRRWTGHHVTTGVSSASTMVVGEAGTVASRRLFHEPPRHRRSGTTLPSGLRHRSPSVSSQDTVNASSTLEDDGHTAATLIARVREAQNAIEQLGGTRHRPKASEAAIGALEFRDDQLRALYNVLLLDAVEEETAHLVHGLVGRTEGVLDAILRSLVVPVVTEQLPVPRGVLKHLRSGASVFLPLELDQEDRDAIARMFPEPPPVVDESSSSGGPLSSSTTWIGAMTSGAARAVTGLIGATTSLLGVQTPSSSFHHHHQTQQSPLSPADNAFVIDDDGYQIRRYQLASLRGRMWVNDQVINYYFHLLQRLFPDVTSLGSHLYAKLAAGDMAGALRWVRRRDIFTSRVVLIAVNLSNSHWTLAVVNLEQKRLYYFDSLQGESHELVLQRVGTFMDQAYAAKYGKLPDLSHTAWPRSTDPDLRWEYYDTLPRQDNYNDCGVFVTQFGLCAACGIAPDFSQDDVTLLRHVLILELWQKKLLRRIHR